MNIESNLVGIPDDLLRLLTFDKQVAVLTGSGVSAESGVPTFRDAQSGLWQQYDPHDLATPEAFLRDPELVWNWYDWRRELIRNALPNPAHAALAELEGKFRQFSLITQNIDGLHQRAGSKNVIELHGNINRARCWTEGSVFHSWINENESAPRCPNCGQLLRPDVVWFGEQLPHKALDAAIEAVENSDIYFALGTSSLVHPAASLTTEAKNRGAVVVEINLEPTPITPIVDYFLQGKAGRLLPNLYYGAFG